MGYASYVLPDGREAGYGVEATCDFEGCDEQIDRGMAFLCGHWPDGHRDPEDYGCGRYFCPPHQWRHDCPRPPCDDCRVPWKMAGHEGPCQAER